MSGLSEAVAGYLATRRALGFRLEGAGRHLEQFAAFAEAAGAETVTTGLALQWATLPACGSRAWHAERLSAVRGFARWLHTIDPQAQIPPADLLPGRTRRATPYLYSETDVTALIDAAGRLNPPWKAVTMPTLIGLLFTTGVRLGEALSLDRGDLDPAAGLLTIRQTKLRKPRQLPLHPSAVTALAGYAAGRDKLRPRSATVSFFVSTTGARLARTTAQETFRRLLRETGIYQRAGAHRPRIHDARHTFAVTTLLGWYRDGADVQSRLPLLSTWLGHTDPRHTYWYLSAAPELLALAAGRLERSPEAAG
jgi:integrase/recombinase XerD